MVCNYFLARGTLHFQVSFKTVSQFGTNKQLAAIVADRPLFTATSARARHGLACSACALHSGYSVHSLHSVYCVRRALLTMPSKVAPVRVDLASESDDESPVGTPGGTLGSPGGGGANMPVTPGGRRTPSSPRTKSITKRLLAKFKSGTGVDESDDNLLFGRKSWRTRTPRTPIGHTFLKTPSLFRNGSSPNSPHYTPPQPILPATLIAPPDENECLVKQAIETEQGIDAKRLFKSLVAIENLQM